jgi:hypothetical protein
MERNAVRLPIVADYRHGPECPIKRHRKPFEGGVKQGEQVKRREFAPRRGVTGGSIETSSPTDRPSVAHVASLEFANNLGITSASVICVDRVVK